VILGEIGGRIGLLAILKAGEMVIYGKDLSNGL
jgi:hypothetical protein